MTEFKKLTALVDKLENDTRTLFAAYTSITENEEQEMSELNQEAREVEKLHSSAVEVEASLEDGSVRLWKLLGKAREQDPNRQIYNESMCEKIEALAGRFLRIAACILHSDSTGCTLSLLNSCNMESEEPMNERMNELAEALDLHQPLPIDESFVLQASEAEFSEHLLRRAQAESWAKRVASGLSDVVMFEGQIRSVLIAEEKHDRTSILAMGRSERVSIFELLAQRAEIKWNEELQRRHCESAKLTERSNILLQEGLSNFIVSRVGNGTQGMTLMVHLRDLCKALLMTPEDISIRKLRNNNTHMMAHFGHPCTRMIHASTGPCACVGVVEVAEAVWCSMGYQVSYSAAGTCTTTDLVHRGQLEDVQLPCGAALSAHEYIHMGFEDYSERLFELREPPADKNPDEWMDWYAFMQKTVAELESLVAG